MYPESFIQSLPEDKNVAAIEMCAFFLQEDARYKEMLVTRAIYNSYIQGIFQFKAYCDPYEMEYSLPQFGENEQENIETIRQFFINVKNKSTE